MIMIFFNIGKIMNFQILDIFFRQKLVMKGSILFQCVYRARKARNHEKITNSENEHKI